MTCSTIVGVIHKLTVNEFADNTCTPTTCSGEIFKVHNVEITYGTMTMPTIVSHHMASPLQNLKSLALAIPQIFHGV